MEKQKYDLKSLVVKVDPSRKRHGNFRVGERKESQMVALVPLENPDEIEGVVHDFLRSGDRIELLKTNVTRRQIMKAIKNLERRSQSYRRVIVREYQGNLYLCRAAFWHGKRLRVEFSDEIPEEIKKSFDPSCGDVDDRVKQLYRFTLPSEIVDPTTEDIRRLEDLAKAAEEDRNFEELIDVIESVSEIKITR